MAGGKSPTGKQGGKQAEHTHVTLEDVKGKFINHILRSVYTDRSDSYFVSDFDVGSIGTYSNIIGIGHFIGIGIGQCECTVNTEKCLYLCNIFKFINTTSCFIVEHLLCFFLGVAYDKTLSELEDVAKDFDAIFGQVVK